MRKELQRLIEIDRELSLFIHIDSLLNWDQETYMPPKAIDERAEQIALVEGLAHERAVSPEIGELLGALGSTSANPMGDPSLSEAERAYLRVLRRSYDRETKLPASLVSELARAVSLGQAAWIAARANNDFPAFAPHLERMVELKRQQADCLVPGVAHADGSNVSRYDALLDLFEPGSSEASIAAVFANLRPELVKLLGKIASRPQVDDSCLHRPCPAARQQAISEYLMGVMGYDLGRGRLDVVAHPFTTTLGSSDVRITTRYLEDFFVSSLFSTVHEAGHALYELGIAPGPEFERTRLADSASMAIHESQSRLWENIVGRSSAFWRPHYGKLAELAGDALGGVAFDSFVRAINKVEPSFIRTEADEVSYGLHVILRFELESDLIAGRLRVKDLPAAWNEKMRSLLGIVPPTDSQGCLQDVHWSGGLFGYFPSYALGNLYAAQFWDAMKAHVPDLEDRIARGDSAAVLEWLRKNVHSSGSTYLPCEIAERATGSALDPSHFVRYLNSKYQAVYGF
jgi:Zn-dependent carboxypeptidase